MSPDKRHSELQEGQIERPGMLAGLSKLPGIKSAALALGLASTASKVAEAAPLVPHEISDTRISNVVNDGNGVVLLGTDNDCGDFAFQRFTGDTYENSDWFVLNSGSTEPVWVPGSYDLLEATPDCGFVGAENGALWKIDRSGGNWDVANPILEGVSYDMNQGLDPIDGRVAWDPATDSLRALTNWSSLGIINAGGVSLFRDNDVFAQTDPDWDPNWHGSDTAKGRYFFEQRVDGHGTDQMVYKSVDDLNAPATVVAEGFGGSLSADGSKMYMAAYDPARGFFRLQQVDLPASQTYYCDSDGDGHGDPAHPFVEEAGKGTFAYQGITYVPNADDCNDGNYQLNIAPRDCDQEPEDTGASETDTVDTLDDTEDTNDTVDTLDDTEDTTDDTLPDTDDGNEDDENKDGRNGCNQADGVNTGWVFAGFAALAARRRKSSQAE